MINGGRLDEATLRRAADAAVAEADVRGDTVASADYRRKLVAALTQRALSAIANQKTASHG